MDEQKKPVRGRPREHASQAERQKAYRARLKERGLRVDARVTPDRRDRSAPLTSDIIDLSACREARNAGARPSQAEQPTKQPARPEPKTETEAREEFQPWTF